MHWLVYSECWPASDPVSDGVSLWGLWTFLCLLRLDTTENWRPHPSTSQWKAIKTVSRREISSYVTKESLRFSPVWLYMWVWSELGRVKRLSQTLHLCFFEVLVETLELKEPIIDCGAGGWLDIKP